MTHDGRRNRCNGVEVFVPEYDGILLADDDAAAIGAILGCTLNK